MKPSHFQPPLQMTDKPPKGLQVSCDHRWPVTSSSGTVGCSHQPRHHMLWLPVAVSLSWESAEWVPSIFQEQGSQEKTRQVSALTSPAPGLCHTKDRDTRGFQQSLRKPRTQLHELETRGRQRDRVIVAHRGEEACPKSQVKRKLPSYPISPQSRGLRA